MLKTGVIASSVSLLHSALLCVEGKNGLIKLGRRGLRTNVLCVVESADRELIKWETESNSQQFHSNEQWCYTFIRAK